MATAKKTTSQKSGTTANRGVAKIASKATPAKKPVQKTVASKTNASASKGLEKKDQLQKLYPAKLSKEEKLRKVMQYAEAEIFDIVRKRVSEAFNTYDYEFDSIIEWLDSWQGNEFEEASDFFSTAILFDILSTAKHQAETDSWNEPHASLTKTARYVFDESYPLFES